VEQALSGYPDKIGASTVTTFHTVGVVLADDLTHTVGVDRAPGREPTGYVRLDGRTVSIQSRSYEALLTLADALQEAARRLRAAQIAGDIETTATPARVA
jgi:hypothetical protein